MFPELIKNKPGDGNIRIWVAGCSTGEEAYSIAICFKEYLGHKKEKVQIFATDLSEPAIAKARSGLYTEKEAEAVSTQRLNEYFTYNNGLYQISKDLRDMCVFAVHNFLKDPPFSEVDFISCRNVLIYMDSYLQQKVLATFHYALNSTGLLMLGKSENTIGITDLFIPKNKPDRIFARKNVPGRLVYAERKNFETLLHQPQPMQTRPGISIKNDFQKIAEDILLQQYVPASVVVNETMDIVYFKGKIFLEKEMILKESL